MLRAKALDLIEAGRVAVADDVGRVAAKVGTYTVKLSPGGRWRCDCTACWYGQACSHAEAVKIVTHGGAETRSGERVG